ncbi:hypothetical protein ACFU5O_14375 [Streptomyces sp. NPDC057445]|uniref:hypothetical protein n=1 Tax=Streptomyces sp. NPDC057445 TaxID=3346136 RepID=UPI003698BDFB
MNDPRIPSAPLPEPDDDYSATALASHWVERPTVPYDSGSGSGLVEGGVPGLVEGGVPGPVDGVTPDRVEGEILRFGPGVTAAARTRFEQDSTATVWHGTLPGRAPLPPERPPSRLTGLRRYTLAGVVLFAVLCFLAWDRYGPGVAVQSVSVRTDSAGPRCDGTAEITALVATNGRAGTLTYRWVRSDGTASQELTERLARGQRQARLRLLWTFQGEGDYDARAEVRITSPTHHSATAGFSYNCP